MSDKTWFDEFRDKYVGTDEYNLEMIKMEITEQISKRLKEIKISNSEFAKQLNVSPAYVTKLMRGESNFTIDTLYKICKVLNTNIQIKFVEEKSTADIQKVEQKTDIESLLTNEIQGHSSLDFTIINLIHAEHEYYS